MPYQGYPDGLYLLKQKSQDKGVDHYGILDVGNRINHPQDTGVRAVLGRITDEAHAIQRMMGALQNPGYDLFGHNCEHFARYVATGNMESTQLQAVGVIAGLTALVVFAWRSGR